MANNDYKEKVTSIIKEAKQKKALKKYNEFCKTDDGKGFSLSEEEIAYYTSNKKGDKKKK